MLAEARGLVSQFRLLPEGAWHLGIAVRRTFALVDGARWVLRPEQRAPEDEEAVAWKARTDVVVRGSVYAAHGAVEQVAEVRVGELSRRIRAHGDRTIEDLVGGRPLFSRAAPFERIPITHERCYGGFDIGASARLDDPLAHLALHSGFDASTGSRFVYPRNHRGCGYFIDVEPRRLIGESLPNLELVDDPIEPERLLRADSDDWLDAPVPAALDWNDPADFPRSAHWGMVQDFRPPAQPPWEIRIGALASEQLAMDESPVPTLTVPGLNGAAPGFSAERLSGGETASFTNMHPRYGEIVTRLPTGTPLLRLRPPGCEPFDIEAQLDSVVFDLDAEELAMVWTGKLQIAGRYPDDELAQVASEVRFP